jgi:hypothetical protein
LRSKTKNPVRKRNLEIFEDNNGNICVQGSKSELLELMHVVMSSVVDGESKKLSVSGRTLYIKCKDDDNEGGDSHK